MDKSDENYKPIQMSAERLSKLLSRMSIHAFNAEYMGHFCTPAELLNAQQQHATATEVRSKLQAMRPVWSED